MAASVDLADPVQTEAFCNSIKDGLSAVDIIVNNAGAYLERGVFAESDPDKWWKTIEVNVRGPYLITRHLIGAMRDGGKIINLTSGKGYAAGANSTAYHVSKAALNMMTNGLANELWQRNIDVNSLVPGPTATATFDNAKPGEERKPEEILALGPDALPKGLPAWGTGKTSRRSGRACAINGNTTHRRPLLVRFSHLHGDPCKTDEYAPFRSFLKLVDGINP